MSQTRPNHILSGTFVCIAILWSSISLGAPVAVIPISPIQLSVSTTLIDFNDDGWNDVQLRNERFGPNQSYYYEDEFGTYSETETISNAWGTILETFVFGTSVIQIGVRAHFSLRTLAQQDSDASAAKVVFGCEGGQWPLPIPS